MSVPQHASHIVLRSYYAHVCSLREYLSLTTLENDLRFIDEDARLAELVASVTVASNVPWDQYPKHQLEASENSMAEIIEVVQKRLFSHKFSGGAPKNILTFGYSKSSYRSSGGGKVDPSRAHKLSWINTNISYLENSPWKRLLKSIGDAAMIDILSVPTLFKDVGNGNMSQLTGTPIFDLQRLEQPTRKRKRRIDDVYSSHPPIKRLRTTAGSTKNPRDPAGTTVHFQPSARRWSAAEVYLPRGTALYAKPARKRDGRVQLGLPSSHVLNSLASVFRDELAKDEPSTPATSNYKSTQEMCLEKAARHLSKHVFPREYGLSSAFFCENSRLRPSFRVREDQIKTLGSCKTPKRIKLSLPHLARLLQLHAKFDYVGWCNRVCPSKLKSSPPADISEVDIPLMDTTLGDITQMLPPTLDVSHPSLVVPHGALEARKECQVKPRFADYAFSHSQVVRYIVGAIKVVFPRAFWGGEHNFQVICSHIRRLVQARRHESVSVHEVLQGLKTADCDTWLGLPSDRARREKRNVSDHLKRRSQLEDFIYWFFESFVLALIKTTFYMTESSAFKNQVLYFRHDDWDVLCRPLVDKLTEKTFHRVNMPEAEIKKVLQQRQLSYSYVRLLPKDTGVRPVVNLSRKGYGTTSINKLLESAFQILNYEKSRAPNLLGAAVSSHTEMYTKLKAFKAKLRPSSEGVLPHLYFVKVDVRACFDTIDQKKLLEILHTLISRDNYTIVKYGQIAPEASQLKTSYKAKAVASNDNTYFVECARKLADVLRNTVFADKVWYSRETKDNLLSLLKEHITENVVKLGNSYYKQTVGIPQGSILSSILCSFFYGDLEEKKMMYHRNPNCVMLRWIDDYIFITTEKAKALSFLDTMSTGHPEYGCFISKEKTLTNFRCTKHEPNVISPDAKGFPWCGLLIDLRSLSVSADSATYAGKHIADYLTVTTNRHPGSTFENKMAKMTKMRSHPIFTDPKFNTPQVAQLNIFHNFMLTAIKTHHYLKSWGINVDGHHRFIWGVIERSLRYTATGISSRLKTLTGQQATPQCVCSSAVTWIGLYAFRAMLRRKPTVYTSLLKDIESALHLPQHTRARASLEPLLNRHTHDLDFIQW